METKTDKQIAYYISDKIWNWKTKDLEDLKDLIQEALNLKQDQILKVVDEVYNNLDMGKTIPIFIQRLKERLNETSEAQGR